MRHFSPPILKILGAVPSACPGTGTVGGCQALSGQRWLALHPVQHLLGALGTGTLHPCLALHGASDVVWNLGAVHGKDDRRNLCNFRQYHVMTCAVQVQMQSNAHIQAS